jgi:hypothetical protein
VRQAAGVPTREAELSDKYILDGHEPVREPDLLTWARWFETADRQVADSMQGDVRVSTVFLGLDHSFSDHGPPVLFETMVFVNGSSVDCERYSTWDEAETGHARWVRQVFKPTPILALPTEGERT